MLKEKLVKLLMQMSKKLQQQGGVTWYDFADHLITNGVMIQEKAHWIPSKKYNDNSYSGLLNYIDGYECSECGRFEEEKEPYCNCGCKMVEEM